MRLRVNEDCCACSYCYRNCPVGAPYFDGEQMQINTELCIGCGRCVRACPMGAIQDTDSAEKPVQKHGTEHLSCDALIIGAGGSGMTAAVRLAEQGRKVLVLEKEKNTGSGALHVAGPMQFVDTKWAREAGAEPRAPQIVKDTIEYGQGRLNSALVEKTIYALPRFFDWFCTFAEDASEGFILKEGGGGPSQPPTDDAEGEPAGAGTGMPGSAMGMNKGLVVEARSYSPESPLFHNSGEFIMTRLFRRAEELGVRILRETRAVKLLRDGNGAVSGVLARDPGGEVIVDCSVCLLATGSLLLSDVVKKKDPEFAGCFQPRYGHTIKAYTGDGYSLCRDAGIPVREDEIWINVTGSVVMPCDSLCVEYAEAAHKKPVMPADLRGHANRPESLMVNLRGERYQNEQMSNISIDAQLKQPQGLSYTILTEEQMKSPCQPWLPVLDENGKPMKTRMPPGMGAAPWNEENMKWLDSLKGNHLIIADSMSELAERAGMDKSVLNATAERYNGFCRAGSDDDFGKNPAYLHPMDHGPFYAIRTFIMSDGAEGGIPIDDSCRVQGGEKPVSNLFAAGDNASGNIVPVSKQKKLWITNEFSWALASGMIAADGMLSELEGSAS